MGQRLNISDVSTGQPHHPVILDTSLRIVRCSAVDQPVSISGQVLGRSISTENRPISIRTLVNNRPTGMHRNVIDVWDATWARIMTMGVRTATSLKWPINTSQVHRLPNLRTMWLKCWNIWHMRTDVGKIAQNSKNSVGECDWGINSTYGIPVIKSYIRNIYVVDMIYMYYDKTTMHDMQ